MSRIEAVVRKEMREILHNRTIVMPFLIPLALFVVLPIGLSFGFQQYGADLLYDQDLAAGIEQLQTMYPDLSALSLGEQAMVMLLRQFTLFFLILPIMGAMSIAAYAIVGEKENRSLEPVLATPITTTELLLGKSLAALVPATLGTWIGFTLYAGFVALFNRGPVAAYTLDLTAFLMIILITPLIGLLGLSIIVVVSSRVTDPRAAQQIGGFLVVPIVLLFAGQMSGLFILGPAFVVLAVVVLVIVDTIVLRAGVHLFDREKILTQWK